MSMIPVNIITGFLGSGKTTFLKEILSSPQFSDTAVIVNEFGEVGLDHILLEEVEEGILLLDSGSICCTIRSDLQETIRDLQSKAASGTIPQFRRIVVETTGLADPAPIVSTIAAEPIIRNHFGLGNIICTLDGMVGLSTLANHEEATKQLAVADRVLITKADIAPSENVARLEKTAKKINPICDVVQSTGSGFAASFLLDEDLNKLERRGLEVSRWFENHESSNHKHEHSSDVHGQGLNSFVIKYDAPIDWTAFGIWLTALLHAHGEFILRVKGLLHVRESDTPVVLHGVQHVVHPPLHLESWPSEERQSKIVFITKGISEDAIRHSLTTFLSIAERLNPGTDSGGGID